ncbi:Ribosome maturation factor RimP [Altererythrobacter insulae]|nr:Ribosome maturation factor RimP [Altererythrobacter insulae]
MADIARLTKIIEPEAKALGFDLVRVKMMPSEAGDGGMALQIMAEDPATGQLIIEQCAALSRAVSNAMDAAEETGDTLIEGAYHLEVSSPGIDRPLTRAKDYANWAGHEAKVSLAKGWDGQRNLRGILKGIEGDMVTIEDNKAGEVSYPLEMVHSAKLVLTDELIAATQPLDTSGVEEISGGADDIIEEEKAQD